MLYAPINVNASGDNTVVAGVTGRRIRVVGYVLVGGGTVTATWKSNTGGGATALSGPLNLAASTVVAAGFAESQYPGDQQGWFETNPGEALNLNLGGAVQVSGHLSYLLVQ